MKTLLVALLVMLVAHDAHAVIGMPLTPFSYAGVARRTVRRTAVVAGTAAVVTTATVAAAGTAMAIGTRVAMLPPSGCAAQTFTGVVYYVCGSVFYRPYYEGPNLVYVVSPRPL